MQPEPATLEQQVRDYLAIVTHLMPLPAGYAYRGPADLVLQTGRSFTPAPPPVPVCYQPGAPGYCFDNAWQLAVRTPGLRYCEGYAAGMFPVEHAWCIDPEDYVVDPTWAEPGQVYLGVVIERAAVRAVRRRGSCSALFDWEADYPLCRRPGAPRARPRA